MRIVFCADSDSFVNVFMDLLDFMPDADSLFVGFYWSNGVKVRRAGFRYRNIPFNGKARACSSVPPVFEVLTRGYRRQDVPSKIKRAIGCCNDFIESILDEFKPDLIVYGCAEFFMSHMLDEYAVRNGIARLGLQTSFVSGKYIAHEHGRHWITALQESEIGEARHRYLKFHSNPVYQITFRRVQRTFPWTLGRVCSVAERVGRVLLGGITFDTVESLGKQVHTKLFRRRWFPACKTLTTLGDAGADYLLVVMNQPCIESDLRLNDLIELAIEAAPSDLPIILRPHPNENPIALGKGTLARLLSRNVFISRVGFGPELKTLVSQCRALLTMNSAVGVEALLVGKPVFTMAPAIYTRPGLAIQVAPCDASRVRANLETPASCRPDVSKANSFCEWMVRDHMVSLPGQGGQDLLDRILALDPTQGGGAHACPGLE